MSSRRRTASLGNAGFAIGRRHNATALVVDALATFRLTRLIVEDTFPPVLRAREAIWERYPPTGRTVHVDDGWKLDPPDVPVRACRWHAVLGLQTKTEVVVEGGFIPNSGDDGPADPVAAIVTESHPYGELIGCPWCVGTWLAFGVVTLRFVAPRVWDPIARALAFSAVAGIVATNT